MQQRLEQRVELPDAMCWRRMRELGQRENCLIECARGRMRTERSKERGSGEREEDKEDASREESMIMVCMDWSGQVVYTEAGRAQRLNSHSHSASDNRQPSL